MEKENISTKPTIESAGDSILTGKTLTGPEMGAIYSVCLKYSSKLIESQGEPMDKSLNDLDIRNYLNFMVFYRIVNFGSEGLEKDEMDSDSVKYLGELKKDLCGAFKITEESLSMTVMNKYLKEIANIYCNDEFDDKVFEVIEPLRKVSSRIVKK